MNFKVAENLRRAAHMFIHIFGFRWKPEATEADKARATKEILA